MATIYFLKQLAQNKITDRHGKVIPFERCSESRGIISVDDEKQSDLVADLRKYIADKKGGVSVIDEETYDHIKKNCPHTPKAPLNAPKLFNPNSDPFSPQAPAGSAGAQAAASPAAVIDSAAPATARGGAGLSKPVSRGKPVRTGRAGQAPQVPQAPAPAEPAAPAAPAEVVESPAPSQAESAATSETPAPTE